MAYILWHPVDCGIDLVARQCSCEPFTWAPIAHSLQTTNKMRGRTLRLLASVSCYYNAASSAFRASCVQQSACSTLRELFIQQRQYLGASMRGTPVGSTCGSSPLVSLPQQTLSSLARGFSASAESQKALEDEINDLFVVARDEIEYAQEVGLGRRGT